MGSLRGSDVHRSGLEPRVAAPGKQHLERRCGARDAKDDYELMALMIMSPRGHKKKQQETFTGKAGFLDGFVISIVGKLPPVFK